MHTWQYGEARERAVQAVACRFSAVPSEHQEVALDDDVRSLVLLLKGAETKQTVVMVFPFTVTQGIATALQSERALKLSKSSLNL